ncbi:MAG: ABC transporter ATP-binding protein [Clostridia bacterium]|nr:ABC transporter ATP-binding protein [Clostridia bacterium]
MIEIKGLSHSFGKKCVLNSIDLSVGEGTVLGLVGINGAGKSTLLRLLSGVYNAQKGCVEYNGASPLDFKTRQDIFFLPDDPAYSAHTTPNEMFEFYRCFYPSIDRALFDKLLSEYKIDLKGKLRNFSKGMRRQTFIALALSVNPKYLLLDEAFDGLDPLSRKIFKEAIIEHVESNNATVIIASHSLRELEDFCDSFVLIDENRIHSHGDIAEHVGRLCKFELAFSEAPNEAMFKGLPIVALSIRGRFVQIVLEAESQEMLCRLSALSPAVIDEMPIDFEETFIHDVEKNRGGLK